MLVILDNGHGIDTPGKRSPVWGDDLNQLFEWEFNRDIVARIQQYLYPFEVESHVLVPEKTDISLLERCRRANKIFKNNPDAWLLSIHGNAFKKNMATGWEAFTSKGETKSDKFATIFYRKAEEYLPDWKIRKDTTDGDDDKEASFAMVKKTACPAVLTENLFYDNRKDCEFMQSARGRNLITQLHVDAIIEIKEEYYEKKKA